MVETVLAVVSHPDDESFWMGGTLATFTQGGARVVVVVAADGMAGRTSARTEQFLKACAVLGIADTDCRLCHWFSDQESDRVSQLSLNLQAGVIVADVDPTLVLTHYHADLNLDHRRVCEAVLVATREQCPVWMCEPEYPHRVVGAPFVPTKLVPVSETLARKQAACAVYVEEVLRRPQTRSKEAIAERARRWGFHFQGGGEPSEAFVVIP